MTHEADVFILLGPDGKLLPPAVQATVLAKYSRSPLSAREIVSSVTPEEAEAFQEKWGVTYGHSSVAELATMPYCFEGVSIVASKFLERYQRPGYSEKSTRYQVFSEESFVQPAGASERLRKVAARLYSTYKALEKPVTEYVAQLVGGAPIAELVTKSTVKARAFDNLRYLLPAGTGTKLAAVVNARDARYMMSDLLGSQLPELRAIGAKMMGAASAFAPVFAMGAKPNSFELPIRSLGPIPQDATPGTWWVRERRGGRASSWDISQQFWRDVHDRYGMTSAEFDVYMAARGNNPVPDIFKTVPISFDIMMDYGAYRDLQRHRRCEQYPEVLSPKYGYIVPDDIAGSIFEATYREAMDYARSECLAMLAEGDAPELVQYGIALGFLHRSIFQMDLKEHYYITELRTQPQGHISYRRVAWEMAEVGREVYPSLVKWNRAVRPDRIEEHR